MTCPGLHETYAPQFSPDVVNHLADNVATPEPSPERQATIDAQIRSRIQTELQHLRQEEEEVREEIERALEKENLDRERAMAGEESESEDGAAGGVKSSAALMGDLEEVRQKVERFQSRRALTEFPEVQARSDAVINCYRCVKRSAPAFIFSIRFADRTQLLL